jgi:hypothetical protein
MTKNVNKHGPVARRRPGTSFAGRLLSKEDIMLLRPQPAALLVLALVTLACDGRNSQSLSSSSPSGASGIVGPSPSLTLAVQQGGEGQTITIFDACDPETFNAALGPDTCSRNGGVRFEMFLEQLRRHHSVGAWHFAPPQGTLAVGQQLVATNQGGETHTFTEVDEYGGGIVPMLNDLTGVSTVAPECNQLQPADFLRPGGSFREVEDESGVEKYQCCIHPWMRAEIRVIER